MYTNLQYINRSAMYLSDGVMFLCECGRAQANPAERTENTGLTNMAVGLLMPSNINKISIES